MLNSIIYIAAGLALLIKGADILVAGSTSLARRLRIPSLLVGLTIVAFGTSTPELTVDVIAAFKGATDIAVGDVIGSCIANIALILGMSAMVYPIVVKHEIVWKEIPRAFFAAALVFVLANDILIDGASRNVIARSDGIVLLLFFEMFLYYVFTLAKNGDSALHGLVPSHDMPPELREPRSNISVFLHIAGGLAALAIGGKLTVDGAVVLASAAGLSQRVISLSVLAIGTSLPELATSVVAAYRKQPDIIVGNVIGSNIFNIFMILGLSAVIRPLPFPTPAISDISAAMGVTALLFVFLFINKKHQLERWQGLAFLAFYVGYLGFVFGRL